jgi:hypothetical protein
VFIVFCSCVAGPVTCGQNEFQCDNKCMHNNLRCNGNVDCEDSSDELDCPEPPPTGRQNLQLLVELCFLTVLTRSVHRLLVITNVNVDLSIMGEIFEVSPWFQGRSQGGLEIYFPPPHEGENSIEILTTPQPGPL